MLNKPFAESCEQNKQVILEVLQNEFCSHRQVLEIGSGTGQHAVFFAHHLPQLIWQCSDRSENLAGIQCWLDEAGLANTPAPLELDVLAPNWPMLMVDAVFSANAVHIMSWSAVEAMFTGIDNVLETNGRLCLYGPFNYDGRYTSDSNARFDEWLKARDPQSGIRDFEALDQLAGHIGLHLINDHAMPANNRILVWQRSSLDL
jgi:cyclopropane fatty-acyl-phospholipid synthase-like methyltransferase